MAKLLHQKTFDSRSKRCWPRNRLVVLSIAATVSSPQTLCCNTIPPNYMNDSIVAQWLQGKPAWVTRKSTRSQHRRTTLSQRERQDGASLPLTTLPSRVSQRSYVYAQENLCQASTHSALEPTQAWRPSPRKLSTSILVASAGLKKIGQSSCEHNHQRSGGLRLTWLQMLAALD